MKTEVLEAYRESFYRGKSRFARALDVVSAAAFVFFIVYVFMKALSYPRLTCITASALSAVLYFIIKSAITAYRLTRHIDAVNDELRERLFTRKLMLERSEVLSRLIREVYPGFDVKVLQTAEKVSDDKIFEIMRGSENRERLIIASVSPLEDTENSAFLCGECGAGFILFGDVDVVRKAFSSTEDEVASELMRTLFAKRKKKRAFIERPTAKRLMLLFTAGALYYLASPLLRYGGYLRLMPLCSIAVALYYGYIGNRTVKNEAPQ